MGLKAMDTIKFSFKEMMMVLPPIFILLGLLDVWVSKDTMVKFMGEGSGLTGVLLSFFLGSSAASPLLKFQSSYLKLHPWKLSLP